MKPNNIFEKLKKLASVKGFGLIVLGITAGFALMLFPSESENAPIQESQTAITGTDYCALLESKAQKLICGLPEVEECSVFITLDTGYQFIYATDQHIRESGDAKETDKTIVLAGNGNGESPILVRETLPTVAGVAVVCNGASYETQYQIIELLCALFDIKSNRISVQA